MEKGIKIKVKPILSTQNTSQSYQKGIIEAQNIEMFYDIWELLGNCIVFVNM